MDHNHATDLPDGAAGLRRGLTIGVTVVVLVAVVGMIVWWPRGNAPELNPGAVPLEYLDATVRVVIPTQCPAPEEANLPTDCQQVSADVTSGSQRGEVARFQILATDFGKPNLKAGDRVVLVYNPAAVEEYRYTYSDFQRSTPLIWLVVLFVVVVIAFGRWKGARALAGIAVTFVVLFVFLLPSLLRGNPALPVALAATIVIAAVVLYLAHGVKAATTVALVGTLISLAVIAALATLFVSAARLTGLAGDESQVLRLTATSVDLRGLLLAGVIIGALGVLDDVTVTQVTSVVELRQAQPGYSRWDLYRSATRIGRDHIASTVNTLVLAYAGASLPLLLLFLQSNQPWARVGASEIVAIEIVRTLVGSIGLVLAVPVTTALAAALLAPQDGTEPPGATTSTPPPPTHDSDRPLPSSDDPHSGADRWTEFGPREEPW